MRIENSTFRKSERMVSRKLTEQLFNSGQGHSLVAFPLRAVYMMVPKDSLAGETVAAQVLMSVSKRHFRHAVDRNRVKRQLREAYRKNKDIVTAVVPEGLVAVVAFLWLADSLQPSAVVEKRMKSLLHRIAEQIKPKQDTDN